LRTHIPDHYLTQRYTWSSCYPWLLGGPEQWSINLLLFFFFLHTHIPDHCLTQRYTWSSCYPWLLGGPEQWSINFFFFFFFFFLMYSPRPRLILLSMYVTCTKFSCLVF
ncbi:hypothetical protein PanWU01x14_251190, partial [Parasponia andersonii]